MKTLDTHTLHCFNKADVAVKVLDTNPSLQSIASLAHSKGDLIKFTVPSDFSNY